MGTAGKWRRIARVAIAIVAIIAVIASGHDGDEATTRPPATEAPATTAPPPTAPPDTAPPEASSDAFGRRDVPEEGVPGQFDRPLGGNGGYCPFTSDPEVRLEPVYWNPGTAGSASQFEVGWEVAVCFQAFEPGDIFTLDILLPDGSEQRLPGEYVGGSGDAVSAQNVELLTAAGPSAVSDLLTWIVPPGAPLGTYVLTADDTAVPNEVVFEVIPASTPRIVPMGSGTAGSVSLAMDQHVTFTLAGFPANETIPLYLYAAEQIETSDGSTAFAWTYATALPPAQTDDRGEASYELPVDASVPLGSYCVQSDATLRGLADGDPCRLVSEFSIGE